MLCWGVYCIVELSKPAAAARQYEYEHVWCRRDLCGDKKPIGARRMGAVQPSVPLSGMHGAAACTQELPAPGRSIP